jgi:hypothetical protein
MSVKRNMMRRIKMINPKDYREEKADIKKRYYTNLFKE